MKILAESNLNKLFKDNEFLEYYPAIPICSGTLETESIKASWMNLGEIVKIETFNENRSNWGRYSKPAISSYTFEVTLWKVVALILFSPIFFLQGLISNVDPLFTKEVKVEEGDLYVQKTHNGEFELEMGPIMLNSQVFRRKCG